MATASLVRKPVVLPDKAWLTASKDLIADAGKKLGYRFIPGVINVELGEALHKLGIEPFSESSVLAYQKDKTRVPFWRNSKFLAFAGHESWIGVGVLQGVALIVMAIATWGVGNNTKPIFFTQLAILTAQILLNIVGCNVRPHVRKWTSTGLDSYNEVVPEYVLRKAIQIADTVPGCTFSVDSLHTEVNDSWHRGHMLYRDPDPFLVVTKSHRDSNGNTTTERYFVEVWDEPKFEAKNG